MQREQLKAYQLQKLKETIDLVYHNVESYRHKMQQAGIIPEDIKTLDDLKKLPFTTKQDLVR